MRVKNLGLGPNQAHCNKCNNVKANMSLSGMEDYDGKVYDICLICLFKCYIDINYVIYFITL